MLETREVVLATSERVVLSLVPGDQRRTLVPDEDVATCGTCHRSWDDGQSTGWTPVPSARCPFEYEHEGVDS